MTARVVSLDLARSMQRHPSSRSGSSRPRVPLLAPVGDRWSFVSHRRPRGGMSVTRALGVLPTRDERPTVIPLRGAR